MQPPSEARDEAQESVRADQGEASERVGDQSAEVVEVDPSMVAEATEFLTDEEAFEAYAQATGPHRLSPDRLSPDRLSPDGLSPQRMPPPLPPRAAPEPDDLLGPIRRIASATELDVADIEEVSLAPPAPPPIKADVVTSEQQLRDRPLVLPPEDEPGATAIAALTVDEEDTGPKYEALPIAPELDLDAMSRWKKQAEGFARARAEINAGAFEGDDAALAADVAIVWGEEGAAARALQQRPDLLAALDSVDADPQQREEALVQALEHVGQGPPHDELVFELGWRRFAQDPAGALALWRKSETPEALWASEAALWRQVLDESGEYVPSVVDQLIALYERLLGQFDDAAARLRWYQCRAQLLAVRGRRDEALATLGRAAERFVDDTSVHFQRLWVATAAGNGKHQLAALLSLERIAGDGELASLYAREGGVVCERVLDDLPGAIEHYRRASTHAPEHRLPREDLRRVYLLSEAWEPLAELLQQENEAAEDPARQRELSLELGLVQRVAGDVGGATAALEAALEADPTHPAAAVEMERFAIESRDRAALAQLWLRMAEARERAAKDDPAARPLAARSLWRAAWSQHALCGEHESALGLCSRALAFDQGAPEVRHLQQEVLSALGRIDELYKALAAELALTDDPGRRRPILLRMVELAARPLNRPEQAVELLDTLLEDDPKSLWLRREHVRVLRRVNDPKRLLAALTALEQEERESSLQRRCRLERAALQWRLGRYDEAVGGWKEALNEQPDCAEALLWLELAAVRSGDSSALLQYLEQSARSAKGEQRRAVLYRLLAVHRQAHADAERQAATLRQLAEDGQASFYPLAMLRRLYQRNRRHDRIVRAFEDEQLATKSPDAGSRSALELAELLQEVAGQESVVREQFDAAAEFAERGSDTALAAWDGIAVSSLTGGDYRRANQAYAQLAEHARNPAARNALLEEQAWIAAEPMSDVAQANALWGQLEGEEARTAGTLWQRVLASSRAGEMARLARQTSAFAGSLGNARLSDAFRARAASFALATGQGELAQQLYRELGVKDKPTLGVGLGLVAVSDADPTIRIQVLRQLQEALDVDRRSQLDLPITRAMVDAGDHAGALERVRERLAHEHDCTPALMIAQQILETTGQREKEARVWLRLGKTFRQKVAQAFAYERAGRLFDTLGQHDLTAVCFQQALNLQPDDAKLFERLKEIYRFSDEHDQFERLISQRLERATESAEKVELYLERARVRKRSLGNLDGAVRDLQRALRLAPKHRVVLERLAMIAQAENDAGRAATYLSRLLPLCEQQQAKHDTFDQLVDVYVSRNRLQQAIELCGALLRQDATDEHVIERLIDLAVAAGDYTLAISSLETVLERATGRARVPILVRTAKLYARRRNDWERAQALMFEAIELDPFNLELLSGARTLLGASPYAEKLTQSIEHAKSEARRLIGAAPLEASHYKLLWQLAEWTKDKPAIIASMGALASFNALSAEEHDRYTRRVASFRFASVEGGPTREIEAARWFDGLVSRAARSAYSRLLPSIELAALRLHSEQLPQRPEQIGGTPLGSTPLTKAVLRVASAFELPAVELFGRKELGITMTAGERPGLVLHHKLDWERPVDRFRIAQALAHIRAGTTVVAQLDPTALEQLFVGALAICGRRDVIINVGVDVEHQRKRVTKALSRKQRKALEAAATAIGTDGETFEAWRQAVLLTANRAALLVCGDVVASLAALVEDYGDPSRRSPVENAALLARNPLASELLPFSVSGQYLGLLATLQLGR